LKPNWEKIVRGVTTRTDAPYPIWIILNIKERIPLLFPNADPKTAIPTQMAQFKIKRAYSVKTIAILYPFFG